MDDATMMDSAVMSIPLFVLLVLLWAGFAIGNGFLACVSSWGVKSPQVFVLNGGQDTDPNAISFATGYNKVVWSQPAKTVSAGATNSQGMTLVGENFSPGWSNTEGGTIFQQEFTSHPSINATIEANDGLGNAVINVLKAAGVLAAHRGAGVCFDSYLEDGYPGVFHDYANYVGWAMLERYVCEDLIGAAYSCSWGGLTSNPVTKAAVTLALAAFRPEHVPAGFAMMFVAGILSALLGIGSGVVKVLAMDRAMHLPYKVSTTTSNFMIGVTAAASAGVYLHRGYIDPVLAMPVVLGVLAGATIGARLLTRVKVKPLRLLFTVVMVILACEMLYQGLTKHI